MVPYIEKYDAVILTLKEYEKKLKIPQVFFMPAIDPFSIKNKKLSNKEIDERLEHYGIPTDLPLVVQISRFDRWKDPDGVIEAFKIARKEVDCTLVLLGNVATDDPEGQQIYESVISSKEDRIIILSRQDTALVNALQSRGCYSKIFTRRLWLDGNRSHVERNPGYRRECGRYPISNKRW